MLVVKIGICIIWTLMYNIISNVYIVKHLYAKFVVKIGIRITVLNVTWKVIMVKVEHLDAKFVVKW